MQIGIISEGHSDRAVISNIIMGITNLELSDIKAILPIYGMDETDKAVEEFGGWTSVRKECIEKKLIIDFLALDGNDFLTIHFDTAEVEEYPVERPSKRSKTYSSELRQRMISKINEWLVDDLSDKLLYAIAIEEMDAWVLAIYDDDDSERSANVKRKMDRVLGKLEIKTTRNFDNYLVISKPLSKPKVIRKERILERNKSLAAFYEEVIEKVLPKLNADEEEILIAVD